MLKDGGILFVLIQPLEQALDVTALKDPAFAAFVSLIDEAAEVAMGRADFFMQGCQIDFFLHDAAILPRLECCQEQGFARTVPELLGFVFEGLLLLGAFLRAVCSLLLGFFFGLLGYALLGYGLLGYCSAKDCSAGIVGCCSSVDWSSIICACSSSWACFFDSSDIATSVSAIQFCELS
jgi:hypothetical protein